MLVVLDAIDGDVVDAVVGVEAVVVVDAGGTDVVATTVVEVLVDEQELMNRSAAIATPGRLNDRKESLSPNDSRRGLTGLPPILGGLSKHTLRARMLRRVFLRLHSHPDKGHLQPADATTLSSECQQPSNCIRNARESTGPIPPWPNHPIPPFHQSVSSPFKNPPTRGIACTRGGATAGDTPGRRPRAMRP